MINRAVPEMRTKISPAVEVRVDGELINEPKENFVNIAFNKPMSNVCKTATSVGKNNIIDDINDQKWIFPIGQLTSLVKG